ncbi:hypothetical protein [Flavobacterium sp.]|uniref:hypothetical protein n=1 Tax=Flavobacterium sp. TaxID=239 RepID=UPI0012112B85|nr:hypothetical protein [Flavobacterium sp.]RZJ69870.1 MAG: hypothetical protein EOO49_15675 [Flavobacterium sp.]
MKTKLRFRFAVILLWILTAMACKQTELAPSVDTVSTETESSSILPFADSEKPSDTKSDAPEPDTSDSKVWVCKSSGATKYHYNKDCGGLKRCTHTIEESTVKDAEAVGLGRCAYKKCQ